jgi:hypothetical protein
MRCVCLLLACCLVHAAPDRHLPALQRLKANCLSATELAAVSNTRLSAEEKTMLKSICIRTDSLLLLKRPANATAFHSRITPHSGGIPDNVTCTETLWYMLFFVSVYCVSGLGLKSSYTDRCVPRCDRANICTKVCERGSVKIDPWLKHATDFQVQSYLVLSI